MIKSTLSAVRISQTLDFWRTGSIGRGTIDCGAHELGLQVDIMSDEPQDKIAELIRVAQESCFTHGALTKVVPVTTTVTLNGKPLEPA